jgi:hypothetical protein
MTVNYDYTVPNCLYLDWEGDDPQSGGYEIFMKKDDEQEWTSHYDKLFYDTSLTLNASQAPPGHHYYFVMWRSNPCSWSFDYETEEIIIPFVQWDVGDAPIVDGWYSDPEIGSEDIKPGDPLDLFVTKTDLDHYTKTVGGQVIEEAKPSDSFKADVWKIQDTNINSRIVGPNTYVAGTDSPEQGEGIDEIAVTIDDSDDSPMDPEPTNASDSRDDEPVVLTGYIKVRFPYSIVEAVPGHLLGPVDQSAGVSWSQTATWKLLDQFGDPLENAEIYENPVFICEDPGTYHMGGAQRIHYGPVMIHEGGIFYDTFGAHMMARTEKRYVVHQHYSIEYGLYGPAQILECRVKLNHFTPAQEVKVSTDPPDQWTPTQISCSYDD